MDAVKRYFRSPAAVIGLILLLLIIAMAVSAGFLYPRDPLALAGRPLVWPFSNPRFLLGTDNSGRDIAAQIRSALGPDTAGARVCITAEPGRAAQIEAALAGSGIAVTCEELSLVDAPFARHPTHPHRHRHRAATLKCFAMHAIITTTGHDRVGIIAGVANAAAERGLNIVDVSQTLMDEYFTMIMRVELPSGQDGGVDMAALQDHLAAAGEALGVVVRIQSEDLFTAMNEI